MMKIYQEILGLYLNSPTSINFSFKYTDKTNKLFICQINFTSIC